MYFVVSNARVEEAEVLSATDGFCVLRFAGHEGDAAARFSIRRVFRTRQLAEASIKRGRR